MTGTIVKVSEVIMSPFPSPCGDPAAFATVDNIDYDPTSDWQL